MFSFTKKGKLEIGNLHEKKKKKKSLQWSTMQQ